MLLVGRRRTHISATPTTSSRIGIPPVVMGRKVLMVMMKHDAARRSSCRFGLIYSGQIYWRRKKKIVAYK
jgi:hypothetical protein